MMHRIERTFAGRPLVIETGRMAKQAAGSAVVQFGETMVLAAVTVSENQSPLPFFPLTVEYKEKTYAAGKIPGGFIKREGRPHDHEILACRIIDRSIRPLFPEGFKNEVQVFVYVISADQENDADVLALLATSFALNASKIPFMGPIGGVRVGRVQGHWVLNPTFQQLAFSDMELIVAGSQDSIVMVEGGALEVSEADVLESLRLSHDGIRELIAMQDELLAKVRQPKMAWTKTEAPDAVVTRTKAHASGLVRAALNQKDKHTRIEAIEKVKKESAAALLLEFPDNAKDIHSVLGDVEYNELRAQVLETNLRVDGRKPAEVRGISIDNTVLPRAHGSSLFTRGQTQALVAATLGTAKDAQRLDTINEPGETTRSFMLHYNFPPFSTGEVRPMRGTSRREIGHGNLAERALQGVLPDFADFPYTIRIVSEVLESNGSSSMASVCGGSLSMLDAGVPLKAPVAGVAMGLILEDDGRFAVLTDILGDEDHLGDMDFKVAGTANGITSLQMDIKIAGITPAIMEQALAQAKDGRMHILGEMAKSISGPQAFSAYAPKIETMTIPTDKIREVIGSGGKVIREIVELSGAKVDINDDGMIKIASNDAAAIKKAYDMIYSIVAEPKEGEVYVGKVVKLVDFGAFVNFFGKRDGLVHVSQIASKRLNHPNEILKEGQEVKVKLLGFDERGKVRLGMKMVDQETGLEIAESKEAAEG